MQSKMKSKTSIGLTIHTVDDFDILRDTQSSQFKKILIEFDDSQKHKIFHDLKGACTALSMNLDLQESSLLQPTPRDLKKFQQLRNHLELVKETIQQLIQALQQTENNHESK